MILPSKHAVALFAFLTATDLARCKSGSGVSSTTLLRDGDSSPLRHVTPSTERGPPPGSQFVPIAVVPLPSGAMRRPSRPPPPSPPLPPPPPPPTTTTSPPQPLVITQEPTTSPTPLTHHKTPRPVPFWATFTDRPRVDVPLIRSEDYRNVDGSYTFAFEAANSVTQEETGFTRHENGQDILVKRGFYRFVSPEGQLFRVDYQADENGFRAFGEHLPK